MEKIKELINSLVGYSVTDSDTNLLEFIYASESQHILNDCNISELSEQLKYIVCERTVAQYIGMKLTSILGDESLNLVKFIKEGDTTVEIGGTSNEERVMNIIKFSNAEIISS